MIKWNGDTVIISINQINLLHAHGSSDCKISLISSCPDYKNMIRVCVTFTFDGFTYKQLHTCS